MAPASTCGEHALEARELLSVADIAGLRIRCMRGSLWLTLDNDPRDIVLEAGDDFVGTEHRRALVYAFQPSTVSLGTAAAPIQQARCSAVRHRAPGRTAVQVPV
ncbi:DUF2917 domain-containing protein [Ramlibacter sp.]|uniref:DUF2917 domain-containing protein n=1 Tax=Ramlibacter sp. TaxID=1917967 RepID=UPI00178E006B|nr:DUF2917 domain-containing protein [Ramlibacter sp.]MBA2676643.1 DUF2917 domain-containing protein [Ramlibacter sp.]